jgi:predicted DNA-binding protein
LVKPDKSRYVWLYLPSKADKERWQALADKARTPLSTFVIEIVESTLAENEEFKPRREMVKELDALRKEVKALHNDLRQKNIVLERYEAELKRYRSQVFLEDEFQGVRRYSKELVEVLKARGSMDSYRLLEALGIDPRESELVKAVSHQLEELEEYGMVEATPRGWRWTG